MPRNLPISSKLLYYFYYYKKELVVANSFSLFEGLKRTQNDSSSLYFTAVIVIISLVAGYVYRTY
jgi:hypothetical protein